MTDVFTRESVTRALPNKNADTVARAAAEAIPDLVQDEGNYVVTTDGQRIPHPGGEPTAGRSAPPEAAPGPERQPPWWTAPSRRLRRTSRAKWPCGAASGTTTSPPPRRPITQGHTRPCMRRRKTWRLSRRHTSGCSKTTQRNSSTTRN